MKRIRLRRSPKKRLRFEPHHHSGIPGVNSLVRPPVLAPCFAGPCPLVLLSLSPILFSNGDKDCPNFIFAEIDWYWD